MPELILLWRAPSAGIGRSPYEDEATPASERERGRRRLPSPLRPNSGQLKRVEGAITTAL